MKRVVVVALAFACALVAVAGHAWCKPARAADRNIATFALVIGVNASLDPKVAPLHYADDDAARYGDLFRGLGARTYLLTRLDDNTRRLHPQAAAEAQPPGRSELRRAVAALAGDVAQARARGVRSVLYVVYAGHGDALVDEPYLTLENERLSGAALVRDVVVPTGADQTHVIIDACQSYLMAFARGPGGERRPVAGFVELEAAARRGRIGYMLSTSPTGESHEWAGFEAGVFSHEVRSGLYGAADADDDGIVTYAEIAAFVTRANSAIANERFRPRIIARPPAGDGELLDLAPRGSRRMTLTGPAAVGHYLLEDEQGVRLFDFHGSGKTPIRLTRPVARGALYLRRVDGDAERRIPPGAGEVVLDAIAPESPRAHVRGAAHHAFSATFSLPFDAAAVLEYEELITAGARFEADDRAQRARAMKTAGWVLLGIAGGAAAAAGAVELSAMRLHNDVPPDDSQRAIAARNDDIVSRNHIAAGLLAGSVLAAGVSGWLFYEARSSLAVTPSSDGVNVSLMGRF